jgi:transcriptional regulator with XRE-family HTH domain
MESGMTQDDYRRAFYLWFRHYPEQETDLALIPFLNVERASVQSGGWLRAARKAQLLSTGQMAERLNISRAAYAKLESRDDEGLVTITKLNELAAVMDCEVVYSIRPKNRQRFSVNIWRTLLKSSLKHNWVQSRPPFRKSQALAAVAKTQMETPKLREENGWSKRLKN